jgi:hypothetical protein
MSCGVVRVCTDEFCLFVLLSSPLAGEGSGVRGRFTRGFHRACGIKSWFGEFVGEFPDTLAQSRERGTLKMSPQLRDW